MVFSYGGNIKQLLKKKENPVRLYSMYEARGHYAGSNKLSMKGQMSHGSGHMKYIKWPKITQTES